MAQVIVIFDVPTLEGPAAEAEVEQRLDKARLLMHNDSSDFIRGTEDPILTYAVVPSTQLLADAL